MAAALAGGVGWVAEREAAERERQAARAELVAVARAAAPRLARTGRVRWRGARSRLGAMLRANPRLVGAGLHSRAGRSARGRGRTPAGAGARLRRVASEGALSVGRGPAACAERALRARRAVLAPAGASLLAVHAPLAGRAGAPVGVLTLVARAPDPAGAGAATASAAALAAALLAVWVALLLRDAIVGPLAALRRAVRELGAGRSPRPLGWRRPDEVGELGREWDRGAAALFEARWLLEGLALRDPLTGLANHRAFSDGLEAELAGAGRDFHRVAVVALDLDHFKAINDRFGHGVGDDMLRLLGSTLTAHLRGGDLCARVGGDEFVLALAGADAATALALTDRVRRAVGQARFGPEGQRLTVSAGVAEFPGHAATRAELMRMADAALYCSKRDGRNRTTVYSPEDAGAGAAGRPGARARHEAILRSARALVQAVDARDGYTLAHSQRVAVYSTRLAEAAGFEPSTVEAVRAAAALHEVGRIGMPTSVLRKIGLLSEREREQVRAQTALGRDLIAAAGMPEAASWVGHLHERWDGLGRPEGLAGQAIPVESRILHLACALDTMTSPPPSRDPKPLRDALTQLEMEAGRAYDPGLASTLVELIRSGELTPGDGEPVPDVFRSLAAPLEGATAT